jgi:hypothetical protein
MVLDNMQNNFKLLYIVYFPIEIDHLKTGWSLGGGFQGFAGEYWMVFSVFYQRGMSVY